MTALNKTDSRLGALREVAEGKISYDARTGTYRDADGTVSGARRRTFAELRTGGAIKGGAPVELTESGGQLIANWS
jgi:hypothetical protein